MTEPAGNYVSLDFAQKMRKQAFLVWMIGLAAVFVWVFVIVAAPVAKANGLVAFSSPLYHFFSFICHQITERSFHVEGEPSGFAFD